MIVVGSIHSWTTFSGLAKDMFLWLSHSLLPFRVVEDEGTKLFLAKYTKIPLEKIPGRKAVIRVGKMQKTYIDM